MQKQKIKHAIISLIISVIPYTLALFFIITLLIYNQNKLDVITWILFLIVILRFVLIISGFITSFIIRIKEIKGGEEDEASKY